MPWGGVGALGVGCKGGRDMSVGSLVWGGVTDAGNDCEDGPSGTAGMANEESAPSEEAGGDAGPSGRFSGR